MSQDDDRPKAKPCDAFQYPNFALAPCYTQCLIHDERLGYSWRTSMEKVSPTDRVLWLMDGPWHNESQNGLETTSIVSRRCAWQILCGLCLSSNMCSGTYFSDYQAWPQCVPQILGWYRSCWTDKIPVINACLSAYLHFFDHYFCDVSLIQ